MFKKAERKKKKLRMAIVGPSGSGKTLTSLLVAQGLGKKIAVIDTEHGSADVYADRVEFDTCQLESFHPQRYIEAIQAASKAGYDVLVIDSFSHAWMGKDGELELAGRNKNSFAGWKDVRPLERRLIETILTCKCHVLVTMRSKTEWVMVEKTNSQGRVSQSPEKMGTAPIQSSGIEYEFDIVGDMDVQSHTLRINKSRCSEIADQDFLHPGTDFAHLIKGWLEKGADFDPSEYAAMTLPVVEWRKIKEWTELSSDEIKKICQTKGYPLNPGQLSDSQSIEVRNICFIKHGHNSGAFKAYSHAANAFKRIYDVIEDKSDIPVWQAWSADLSARIESKTSQKVAAPGLEE